ncbi:MAG TPA: hypothetical protein VH500_17930 [Nitrososphaeraceae archaeon]
MVQYDFGSAGGVPRNVNPSYDDSGRYCTEGQTGPVWFLTSSYKHVVDRHCNIPAGKSILLAILNSECSFAEFPSLKTEQDLRNCAKQMQFPGVIIFPGAGAGSVLPPTSSVSKFYL